MDGEISSVDLLTRRIIVENSSSSNNGAVRKCGAKVKTMGSSSDVVGVKDKSSTKRSTKINSDKEWDLSLSSGITTNDVHASFQRRFRRNDDDKEDEEES